MLFAVNITAICRFEAFKVIFDSTFLLKTFQFFLLTINTKKSYQSRKKSSEISPKLNRRSTIAKTRKTTKDQQM